MYLNNAFGQIAGCTGFISFDMLNPGNICKIIMLIMNVSLDVSKWELLKFTV